MIKKIFFIILTRNFATQMPASWGRQPNKKKIQLKSNKSNKMLGFLLVFLKTPTPNSDRQCWVFLLDFCWVFLEGLFDFCWVFVSFVGFLLGFWLICWIFVGSRSLFNFILWRSFVYFKYVIFYRGSS